MEIIFLMKIREYRESDAPSILEIDKLCYPTDPYGNVIIDQIKDGKCWVATEKKQTIGFLIATMDEGFPYLYYIAIRPEYQGKGLGTRLINKFHNDDDYKFYPRFYLHVDNMNIAQSLYFKMGYRVVDVEPHFYGEQTTGLKMCKSR